MVGGRGVRGRRPGVVGVAVASSSRQILNRLFSVCGATVGSPIARAPLEPHALAQGCSTHSGQGFPVPSNPQGPISLCRNGRVRAAKKNVGRRGVQSGLAAEADLCHIQRHPPGPRDSQALNAMTKP